MANDSSPFRSILVPLDGSELATQALPVATTIIQQSGGKLRLALVHEHPAVPLDAMTAKALTALDQSGHKAERAYLRRMQAQLREDGIRVSSAVTLMGMVGPALVTYVRDLGIDLVVMATHGRGGIRRVWLGSTADYLVRHLEIPVLLVRPESARPMEIPRRGTGQILVPLDGSPLAEQALEPALELARVWDADVRLLQVVQPVLATDPMTPVPSPYDEELTVMARTKAQNYLDQVVQRLNRAGVRTTGSAEIGWRPADSILEAARSDLVVMLVVSTHGRGGLRRVVLGSVADKLVRGAEVPVLVRRPAGHVSTAKRPPRVPVSQRPRRLRALT